MIQFMKYFLVAIVSATIGALIVLSVIDNNKLSLKDEELIISLIDEHRAFNDIVSSPEAADYGFDDFFKQDFAKHFMECRNKVDSLYFTKY